MNVDGWKQFAAEAAAGLVRDEMLVGLGSGTTVAHVIRALSRLGSGATFVPSSSTSQRLASKLGLRLESLSAHKKLDLMLDGADEVDPNFNLIKGRGGAHTREKIVASASRRVVIVVDRTKLVRRLGEQMPVPVEVLPFAREYTIARLEKLGGKPKLRQTSAGTPFVTDNGNYIVDIEFGSIQRPTKLEREINRIPGVIENGLFVGVADAVLVGHEDGCAKLRSKRDFLKFMRA